MTKIYTVRITNGSVTHDQFYLASENDYLEDLCYSEYIVDAFISSGQYPCVDDILDDPIDNKGGHLTYSDAEMIIYDDVQSDLRHTKSLATIEDLDNLTPLPESYIYDDCEEIRIYRKIVLRDNTIDEALKD
tara:strand:+ start:2425 stop:2820 length:396 start_codon:yes stop_codon:yes gene_type:complete